MDDRLERDLRSAGRAARAEVEAGLDLDTALARVRAASPTDLPAAPVIAPSGRRPIVWLAAAAAAAVAVVLGAIGYARYGTPLGALWMVAKVWVIPFLGFSFISAMEITYIFCIKNVTIRLCKRQHNNLTNATKVEPIR